MKLYHGTTSEFDEIDLSKSKPNKDFGRGFIYLPNWNRQKTLPKHALFC